MICGFLSPDGKLYSCTRYGHTSKAEQIITELNIKRKNKYGLCEDELLENGWICIRTSDVYKRVYDENMKILFITDEQKSFFEKHKNEFSDAQLADIYELLRDFGQLRELREKEEGAE